MQSLDPILVERKESQFKRLCEFLESAANLLIPDAQQSQKEDLLQAKSLCESQFAIYQAILNCCASGVIFNESNQVNATVEQNVNLSVSQLLWKSLDIISDVSLFYSDFTDYLSEMSNSSEFWKSFPVLCENQGKFDSLIDSLDQAASLILNVIKSIDEDY